MWKGFEDGYVRSDLYTAALERIAELEAERDGYRSAAHKMHDAFVGSGMAGAFNQDLFIDGLKDLSGAEGEDWDWEDGPYYRYEIAGRTPSE